MESPVPAPARPTGLIVRPLTAADAEEIATWQYDGPWRVYDSRPEDRLSAESGYEAVADGATGELVGFICLGPEARVPGVEAEAGVVDIGAGLRPDQVGDRVGSEFGPTILAYIRSVAGEVKLRALVQSWNERSLRLCSGLGFRAVGTHTCTQDGKDVTYVVLVADGVQAAPRCGRT
jgi:ribosomal-protein-alanine N-acetyltransferase